MNYAHLAEWIRGAVDDLVGFGVPLSEAEALLKSLECDAMNAATRAKQEHQFLIDFKRDGATELARRYGKSPQAMWQKRRKILSKANSPRSVATQLD